ncbi:MAG: glucose-1-phosphate adenylyltransferase [Oscillospiraceae bacterium]|nr:glucose-1-phosphate adenylyltransferase [Oscillospiraceae bacterium]
MFAKKECVAMLLAGGQGSRLQALTKNIAKPAIQFGGKYRIIDFPLSNCINSGIDTVGVLTQYSPLVLNEYVGAGQPWDLDRLYGGVHILPPYQSSHGASWYAGTANAIYQNINFVDRYDPEYVLILSGDHIYKMNYDKMIKCHKESLADCTIAVLEVSKEEAPRFGIVCCDESGFVYKFEEKPKNPSSNLASMGIYIFNWKLLKKLLQEDETDQNSDKDFGKNIMPKMLKNKLKLKVYPFKGYWKDVGTIESLFEANIDLIKDENPFNLYNSSWKIYTRSAVKPPQHIGKKANVLSSLVTEGCQIDGDVSFCVLSPGVVVEKGASVKNSVIMSNSTIKARATINYSIIGENCVIGENSVVGEANQDEDKTLNLEIAVIGPNTKIKAGENIKPKSIIEKDV